MASATAAPGSAVRVCTFTIALTIGAPFAAINRPLIGTRFPNFTFIVDERLFASAVNTTRSPAGEPFGSPRSPPPVAGPGAGFEGSVARPAVSTLLGVVLLELGRATTGGVGPEQLVALPPEFAPVAQNCSAWPMSSAAAV